MTRYIIGDVQGCFDCFEKLRNRITLHPDDEIWLAGDIVNRGPQSLQMLRYAQSHKLRAVLGNHDLHLLMRAAGIRGAKPLDIFEEILEAPDRDLLLDWLSSQPLILEAEGLLMVHAGIHPSWTLEEARDRAREVELALRSGVLGSLKEKGSRVKETVGIMTRMRMLRDGRPDYAYKGCPEEAPGGLVPWFSEGHPDWEGTTIFFGHWATMGFRRMPGFVALDSGCVWGGELTAVSWPGLEVQSVSC